VVAAIIAAAVIIVAYLAWRAFATPPHAPVANPPSAGVPLDPRANPARGPKALRYVQPR
jgi:hypothetical protein